MSVVEQEVKRLNEKRMRTWQRGKDLLDVAAAQGRELTLEETANFDRVSDDISAIDRDRDALLASTRAQDELATVNDAYQRIMKPVDYRSQRDSQSRILDDFFRREVGRPGINRINFDLSRAANAAHAVRGGASDGEFRAIIADGGSSGGSLVIPTVLSSQIYAYLTAEVAVRRTNVTILTRPSGAPFVIPKVSTHGAATQVATQATAIGGSDPVLATSTLNFYKAGQLLGVSTDILEDTSVDVLGFVAANVTRAVGQLTDQWYVTGTGSSQPQGFVSGVTGSGTIATGGSLIDPSVEQMIDLEFSIVDSYRQNASWFVADTAAKSLRKLRADASGTSGPFLWEPSPTRGLIDSQPDRFMGYPIYTDVNVAALGSNSVSWWFGDLSRNYCIADAIGFEFERSDDYAFNLDQVFFRGTLRTAGQIQDSHAGNVMKRSV